MHLRLLAARAAPRRILATATEDRRALEQKEAELKERLAAPRLDEELHRSLEQQVSVIDARQAGPAEAAPPEGRWRPRPAPPPPAAPPRRARAKGAGALAPLIGRIHMTRSSRASGGAAGNLVTLLLVLSLLGLGAWLLLRSRGGPPAPPPAASGGAAPAPRAPKRSGEGGGGEEG